MRTPSIRALSVPGSPVFPVDGATAGGGTGAAFLGILMLATRFPRPPGDIGHPASFPVPTRQRVVRGATPEKIVQDASGLRAGGLLADFVSAALALEGEGAAAITTSCGFLVLFQRELQAAVRVPLVTSSLVMLPALLETNSKVGVLTASAQHLGSEHLSAAGVPPGRLHDVLVEGMPAGGEFARAILGNAAEMDAALVAGEAVAAARKLHDRAPSLRTLVLECTNLPPYAAQITQATGLQTHSLLECETLLRPFRP